MTFLTFNFSLGVIGVAEEDEVGQLIDPYPGGLLAFSNHGCELLDGLAVSRTRYEICDGWVDQPVQQFEF